MSVGEHVPSFDHVFISTVAVHILLTENKHNIAVIEVLNVKPIVYHTDWDPKALLSVCAYLP